MGTGQATALIDHLRRAALLAGDCDSLDGELLEAFIVHRDNFAFEAIVRRHGPMVLGVCRRVLQNHHDAEDAFQATFLVLARKAASVKPRHMVGNWLHGVAYRTALEARTVRGKRLSRQSSLTEVPEMAAQPPEISKELQLALDEELNRLPDHYRVAIVLCDLEGKTQKEAARQLLCPPGTVACRLARGRALLAKKLARHGLTLSGGALGLALGNAVSASVPATLVVSTVKAAATVAAGGAATAVVSAKVAALTEGVMKTMLLIKLKNALVTVLAVALVTTGVGRLAVSTLTPTDDKDRVVIVPGPMRVAPSDGEVTEVVLPGPKVVTPADDKDTVVIVPGPIRVATTDGEVTEVVLPGPKVVTPADDKDTVVIVPGPIRVVTTDGEVTEVVLPGPKAH